MSEVMGTILMVGITVILMAGVSLAVLSVPPPADRPSAQLATRLDAGDDLVWGTGDESILVAHRGGERLTWASSRVQVTVDGVLRSYAGLELEPEGRFFSIGDTMRIPVALHVDAIVGVEVYTRTNSDQLVASAQLLVPSTATHPGMPPPLWGGTAPSPVRYTYVAAHHTTQGTVSAFANAQNAEPPVAALKEGFGVSLTETYRANAVLSAGGFSETTNVLNPDSGYASAIAPGSLLPHSITPGRFSLADPVGNRGPIVAVLLKAEVRASSLNSEWHLRPCLASCGVQSLSLGTSLTDTVILYDITLLRPGGGTWTWTDISSLDVTVTGTRPLAGSGVTFQLKHVWAEVISLGVGQRLDTEFHWTGVPSAASHTLEVRYSADGERFLLSTWNGATWNVRGTLDSGTQTTFSLPLTASEWNGGAPRIRIQDHDAFSLVAATLDVQFARVVSR